jgi:hypothetical protein
MPTDIERDSLILHVSPEHERQRQCHQPQLSVSSINLWDLQQPDTGTTAATTKYHYKESSCYNYHYQQNHTLIP